MRSAVPPEATEVSSYRLPTFRHKGPLVRFAGRLPCPIYAETNGRPNFARFFLTAAQPERARRLRLTVGRRPSRRTGSCGPLECGSLEVDAHTIATVRLRNTIYDSRVLGVFANQGRKQRHFARLPVSTGKHSSAVRTDVYCDRQFASPGLCQTGEVDLHWKRGALLNSRVETLQARILPLRIAITALLA